MSEAIIKKEERSVEFVPFGSQDKVRLTIEMVKNLIAIKTKTGKTCSDADAIKFVAMCQARRLNPFEGDAYLIGYDGREGPQFSLITAHQAFLKRAELNAEYDGMKSGVIVDRDGQVQDLEGDFYIAGDKVLGGWATVYFKNRKQPMHKRIRLERFKKPFGIWLEDSAGMICKCAEADALRSSFPTMLGGLYLREETQVPADAKTTTPIFTASDNPPVQEAQVAETRPATPPAAPKKPEPKPAKNPEPAPETPTPIESRIKAVGLSEADITGFLYSIGSTDEDYGTIAKLEASSPEVYEMLVSQFADIIERIKSVK